MKILLIIPPFTQINTVYPSILQLSNFLKKNNIQSKCLDLSNKTFLKIFSSQGLKKLFDSIEPYKMDESSFRLYNLRKKYIHVIDLIIKFLQGKDNSLAYYFIKPENLPQGKSFENINYDIVESDFGKLSVIDKAKHFCSLVIDDLTFFIKENISEHFELSKYAEKLAESNKTFNILYKETTRDYNIIEETFISIAREYIEEFKPNYVAFSIPFPGNLLSALIISKFIKKNYPGIKIIYGGGYVNTELRQIKEKRIFEFCDFITLDDGELPLLNILLNESRDEKLYIRTFFLSNNAIIHKDNAPIKNLSHGEIPAPDYTDINPQDYPAFLEMLNSMHRLWSDGFTNKLTLAHGCYWAKCTFCDVTLDYIGRYNPATASQLVDNIEQIIQQTGRTNFHFTDEAAPPALLKNLSIELLKRNVKITWWGNIRFEKSFTPELTYLMAKAGCIAVTGGIEVANERLLKLINKGVTLEQAANVCKNFKDAGILVHGYLMYGFPTQTEQEVIDSLEVVRQFFYNKLLDSAFWHQFSLTIHSPIYQNPEKFNVIEYDNNLNDFANNNVNFKSFPKIKYDNYTYGLDKALYNFMLEIGLSWDVRKWFNFSVPKTALNKNLITQYISKQYEPNLNGKILLWFESLPIIYRNKILFHTNDAIGEWDISIDEYKVFKNIFHKIEHNNNIVNLINFDENELSFIKNNSVFREFLNEKIAIII